MDANQVIRAQERAAAATAQMDLAYECLGVRQQILIDSQFAQQSSTAETSSVLLQNTFPPALALFVHTPGERL